MHFFFNVLGGSTLYDPDRGTGVFKWCLDKIVDPNGNYVQLSYAYDYDANNKPRQIYLDEIIYTGNATASPTLQSTNSVKFVLEDGRTDVSTSYVTGFATRIAKRLKTIEVRAANVLVRKYELSYTANGNQYSPLTGRSVLGSVTEYGNDGVTAKPPITLEYSNGYSVPGGAATGGWNLTNHLWLDKWLPVGLYCLPGKFGSNFDVLCSNGRSTGWDLKYLFNDPNYVGVPISWPNGQPPALDHYPLGQQCITGDFKGEGNSALACNFANNGDWTMVFQSGTLGETWTTETWHNAPTGLPISECFGGDFDGNGKADFACYVNGVWQMALSTGSAWTAGWTGGPGSPTITNPRSNCLTGDFDGNGKTDLACNAGGSGYWKMFRSSGNGWTADEWSSSQLVTQIHYDYSNPLSGYCLTGDFNGDGKTDITCFDGNATRKWHVALSTGIGWDDDSFAAGGFVTSMPISEKCLAGDFNGDGRTDIACHSGGGSWNIMLSLGTGWSPLVWSGGPTPTTSVSQQCFSGDFNSDGKSDIVCYPRNPAALTEWQSGATLAPLTDLLTRVANGLGGEIGVSYQPALQQLHLPFSMQLLSAITVSDGNGNSDTTSYSFSGGYYHVGAKDFRGFNQAMTSRVGSDGKRINTRIWFHQGDATAVGVNDPGATAGFMKGKPYLTRISNDYLIGGIYSETETTYQAAQKLHPLPYNFNPPQRIDTYICDGNAYWQCKGSDSARQTAVEFGYDNYGNIAREYRYGDVANPANTAFNMTIFRSFEPNVTDWLIGLPTTETVFQGIGYTDSGTNLKVRHSDYYYDDLAQDDCNATPTGNQQPVKGNLTRVSRWQKDGAPVETRTAYDAYGNPACSRDANGNVTTLGFDTTYRTFPATSANAKSHPTTSSYYGVGISADKGRYGQLKSVTDPNNAATTFEYDTFGRKTKEVQPDSFWSRTAYNAFGTVGSQHVFIDNQLGLWSAAYFDGLGRTFKTRKSGPDNNVIVSETAYDPRGLVSRTSLPYFEGKETPLYRTFSYDLLGRPIRSDSPDATFTLACYNDLVTVRIDENGHRKRETKDPLGRLVKVQEYEGTYAACDTAEGAPYATTVYSYDVLGNLTGVLVDVSRPGDAANPKTTTITYDTLGRKTDMIDPDMGRWDYTYYPDGTLHTVKDANHQENGQLTTFDIDVLNRTTRKSFPADSGAADVVFAYDEATSTNAKGRLTTMSDSSGSTTYHYDRSGRPTRVVKRVESVDYPVTSAYDGLGRLDRLTYPDNESIDYTYDSGGNLSEVSGYAEYGDYNALGQPGKLYFGNGIVSSYWYHPKNYRLFAIKTDRLQETLLYRTYSYDNKGNVTATSDLASPAIPHNIVSGNVGYTLDPNRAHAVQTASTTPARVFLYDANGNMKSDGQRSVVYTPENMPQSITMDGSTTGFTYDGNGKRVKKTGEGTRLYIGKLHECAADCANYIYAGATRIAKSSPTATIFYHPDHLGSTALATDAIGATVENIAYYPFGETRQDDGNLSHKFTGQELDSETGNGQIHAFYNYGARLYDPEIGRFITPDSAPPNILNPQSINPYAYCGNNPLKYTDPSGKSWFHVVTEIPGSLIGWAFGGMNPLQAISYQFNVDRRDLTNYESDAMARHATTGAFQSWSNAMGAAWDNFTNNVGNINTSGNRYSFGDNSVALANHTFADIISHFGTPWTKSVSDDWLATGWHYVVNDIIMGAITAPIAMTGSIVTNLYAGIFGTRDQAYEGQSAGVWQNTTTITGQGTSSQIVYSDGTSNLHASTGTSSTASTGSSGWWDNFCSWLFDE